LLDSENEESFDIEKETDVEKLRKEIYRLRKLLIVPSEEKYKLLSNELTLIIDSLPALVFYKDTKNNFIRVNKYIAETHNTTKEKLEGKSLFELYPKEMAQKYWEDDLKVINSGESIINIEEIWDVGNEKRWALTSKILEKDEKGEVKGIIGVSIDITDRKNFEVALHSSENKYRRLFESNRDGIVFTNLMGKIEDFNEAYLEMLGYTKEKLTTLTTFNDLTPVKWHEIEANIVSNQIMKQGYSDEYEKEYIKKDGTRFPVSLKSWLIKDEKGNNLGIWSIARDITERKRQEEYLVNDLNELQKLTDELGKSNKELDDFAYISSHDLREPLRGINNYSKFLLEDYSDKLDVDGKNMLKTISKLTVRLEQFIDSLLFYSRLGRTSIVREKVPLREIIDEVIDSFEFAIQEKPTIINILDNQPVIECDRLKTTEIYKNLIGNALKYNDKPERCITIGYSYNNKEAKTPVLYVRDNGIGIEEKHIDLIFTIFKRLHPRDKFGGGTGAGLTIAKKSAELQQGKIWLDSKLGEGTTFYFTIDKE